MGGRELADINVGGVTATVRLDATQFDKGITRVETGLSNLSSAFQSTQKSVDTSIQGVTTAVQKMHTSVQKDLETFGRGMELLDGSVKSSSKQIKQSIEAVGTSTKAVSTHIQAFKKSSEDSFKKLITAINKLTDAFRKLDIVTGKDFGRGIDRLTSSKGGLEALSKQLASIEKQTRNTSNALKGLKINQTQKINYNFPTKTIVKDIADANNQMGFLRSNSDGLLTAFQKMSFNIFLLKSGISQMVEGIKGVIGPGVEFNKMIETESYGMSGILMSMTEADGKAWEFGDALKYSKDIIKDLNMQAVKTAATSTELITTFRALLGPGLGAGMSIDQIKDFTVVGVNAVKSMGLEGRQLVQELRDLVQGGIQAASSTLATALGLKDADIKAAKNSAEGLFAFLMKRMQGFQEVSQKTPETLQGMMAVVGGASEMVMAEAMKPINEELKSIYSGLVSSLLTTTGELNQDLINSLTAIVQHALNLFNAFKNVSLEVLTVLKPALELAGNLIGFACDNAETLINIFLGFTLVKTLADLYNMKTAVEGTYTATTILGRAIQSTGGMFAGLSANSKALAAQEKANALSVAQTELQAMAQRKQARLQLVDILKEASEREKKGQKDVADSLKNLANEYKNLGLSAQEAYNQAHLALQVLQKGGRSAYENVVEQTKANLEHSKALEERTSKTQALVKGIWGAVGVVTALTEAYKLCADEENKEGLQMASNIEKYAITVAGIATLITSLKDLGKAFEVLGNIALKAWAKVFAPLTVGAGTIAAGIAIVVGAIWGIQKALQAILDIDDEELHKRYFYTKQQRDRDIYEKQNQADAELFENDGAYKNGPAVTKKNFGGGGGNSKGAKKALNNAYKDLDRDLAKYKEVLKGYSQEISDAYKNDLMSTQVYVQQDLAIKRAEFAKEEEILKKKLALAKEESDIEKFKDELEKLDTKKKNAELEATRKLTEEYKKLDERLDKIKGKYQSLVGVTEEAFKEKLVKEVCDDYSRLSKELETANLALKDLQSDSKDFEVWTYRKSKIEDTIKAQERYIALQGIQKEIDKESASIQRASLAVTSKFIEQQSLVDAGSRGSLALEYEIWRERQRNAKGTIESYQKVIAYYKAMEEEALKYGSIEKANDYTKKWQDAKKAMLDFANELSPIRKEIQSTLSSGFADAYQDILWGEKDFITAFSDMWKDFAKKFTQRIFDEAFTGVFDDMFNNLFPKSKIEGEVTAQVNVDTKPFVEDITSAAMQLKDNVSSAMIPSLTSLSDSALQAAHALDLIANKGSSKDGGTTSVNIDKVVSNASPSSSQSNTSGYTFTSKVASGNYSDYSFNQSSQNKLFDDLKVNFETVEKATYKFTSSLLDGSANFNALRNSIADNNVSTKVNTKDTMGNALAVGMMTTSLLASTTASEKFQKALMVLQAVMSIMSIGKSYLGWFADGGLISGPGTGTSDSIPARLSNGEYVMKASTVRKYGSDFFDMLNYGGPVSGRLPKFAFADGGLVQKADYSENTSSNTQRGNDQGGTVVNMNMTFQSLDPESNMKMMEAQYPTIRQKLLKDLQGNSMVRTAVRGVR